MWFPHLFVLDVDPGPRTESGGKARDLDRSQPLDSTYSPTPSLVLQVPPELFSNHPTGPVPQTRISFLGSDLVSPSMVPTQPPPGRVRPRLPRVLRTPKRSKETTVSLPSRVGPGQSLRCHYRHLSWAPPSPTLFSPAYPSPSPPGRVSLTFADTGVEVRRTRDRRVKRDPTILVGWGLDLPAPVGPVRDSSATCGSGPSSVHRVGTHLVGVLPQW